MPGISNEINNNYSDVIGRIKAEVPDAEIISAQKYNCTVQKQKIRFGVTALKKASMLEEYIMKAAGLELSDGMDISRLSVLLGMDEVFLAGCIDDLTAKNLLDKSVFPQLKLTESGKKHMSLGTVPANEEIEEIEYYIDKKSGIFYTELAEDDTAETKDYYALSDTEVPDIKKYINRKFICDVAKAYGRDIEPSGGAQRITSMISAKTFGEGKTAVAEVLYKTPGSDNVMCKIWDYAKGMFRDDLAKITVYRLDVDKL